MLHTHISGTAGSPVRQVQRVVCISVAADSTFSHPETRKEGCGNRISDLRLSMSGLYSTGSYEKSPIMWLFEPYLAHLINASYHVLDLEMLYCIPTHLMVKRCGDLYTCDLI
jgi:hypothetical protein